MGELLGCPFCNGEAVHKPTGSPSPGYWVQCSQCGVSSSDVGSRENAARLWNTRAPTAPLGPVPDPLRVALQPWLDLCNDLDGRLDTYEIYSGPAGIMDLGTLRRVRAAAISGKVG